MVRQETAFIKAEGRYANTGRSQGTATRGLMQGPRALSWVGGELSAAGEATGQVWSEEGGTLGLLRVGPFTIQNNHLSIFKKQNIHQGELQLKSSTPK